LIAQIQWILGVRGINDKEIFLLFDKPSPSRSEISQSIGDQFLREIVNAFPFRLDFLEKFACRLRFEWTDAIPVKGVIPMLGSVVVDLLVPTPELIHEYFKMISYNVLFSHSVLTIRSFKFFM
jgi:hypothetical protein